MARNDTTFKKGWKGGPGRPKGGNLEWCREFIEKEGKAKLIGLARSGKPKIALQALTIMLAYGYGKPTEHHDVTSDGKSLVDILTEARSESDES